MPPILGLPITTLDFGSLPRGQESSRTFFVINEGDRPLSGELRPSRNWLSVQPNQFDLSGGEKREITATVRTAGLRREIKYRGEIQVESNGGAATVDVRMVVATSPQDRLWERVSNVTFMALWGGVSGAAVGVAVSLIYGAFLTMPYRDALIGLVGGAGFGFLTGFFSSMKNAQEGVMSGLFTGPLLGGMVGLVVRAAHATQVGEAAFLPAIVGAFGGTIASVLSGLVVGAVASFLREE